MADRKSPRIRRLDNTPERRLAANIRALRAEAGISQQWLAAEMVAAGCTTWTAPVVANVERLDKPRAVTIDELGALCVALRCALDDLLAGMPELIDRLHGRSRAADGPGWTNQVLTAQREEVRADLEERIARSIGVDRMDVQRAVAALRWPGDLLAERSSRMHDRSIANLSQPQRLGHITRAITAEIAAYLDTQGDGPS